MATIFRCWPWLGVVAVVAGCGAEAPSYAPAEAQEVRCFDPALRTPCDVRDEACQQRVFDVVACLKGGGPLTRPPVGFMTPDELRERFIASFDPEGVASFNAFGRGLALLHLQPKGAELVATAAGASADFILGIYEDDTDRITLIDHGTPFDDRSVLNTLAHEYVHAIQDQQFDLTAMRSRHEDHTDASLAFRGLVEGDAVFHELVFAAAQREQTAFDVAWDNLHPPWQGAFEDSLFASAWPWAASQGEFPYAFGCEFVADRWRQDFDANFVDSFGTPPISTFEVLYPLDGHPAAARLEAPAAVAAPAGWRRVTTDVMGAWSVHLFVGAHTGDRAAARGHSRRWEGDRVDSFGSAEGSLDAIVWTLRFDGPDGARAFAHAAAGWARADDHWRVAASGPIVSFLAVSDPTRVGDFDDARSRLAATIAP